MSVETEFMPGWQANIAQMDFPFLSPIVCQFASRAIINSNFDSTHGLRNNVAPFYHQSSVIGKARDLAIGVASFDVLMTLMHKISRQFSFQYEGPYTRIDVMIDLLLTLAYFANLRRRPNSSRSVSSSLSSMC